MRKIFIAILCIASIFISGCASNNEYTQLVLTQAEFPRMDGSTATIPLGEAVAAVLMGISREEASQFAVFTGTDSAHRRLANREVDLLIVYGASQQTKDNLPEYSQFKRAAIGSDALVFLVNVSNPVDSLTICQIRGIYTGEITNWSEVGGLDAPIAPFQRNATAGSQALMESLVMGDTPMMNPPEHFLHEGMGMMVTAVSNFDTGQNAIGYNVFYFVTEMLNDPNVKIIAVNGVAPEKSTIADGSYPLTNNFYAIIREEDALTASAAFLVFDWLQGIEGQTLIDLEGYAALMR